MDNVTNSDSDFAILVFSFTFLPITFLIAFGLGFLTKKLSKSNWHSLTFTAIIMTAFCLTFYISEYRPSFEIPIPENYVGEVKLLVSDEANNDFKVNKFGIGYISHKTFKNGFQPTIIKGGQDITSQIKGFSIASYAVTTPTSNLSIDYVTFEIPGQKNNMAIVDLDELVKLYAIDTTRLWQK